jgi:hypothetical protein
MDQAAEWRRASAARRGRHAGLADVAFEDGELCRLHRGLDAIGEAVAEQKLVVARMLVGEGQHAPAGVDHAFGLRQGRHEMLVCQLADRAQDRRAIGEVRIDAGRRGLGALRHVADGDGLVAILAPQRIGGLGDTGRQGRIGLTGHVDY